MGGDVVRTLPAIAGFLSQYTYGLGTVHKLITIDTPHQGSPLANALATASQNTCPAKLLAASGLYAFATATVGGTTYNGAIGDLQVGSSAINAIHSGAPIIPTAMIGGVMSQAQLNGAGLTLAGALIRLMCPTSSLGRSLNSASWPALMAMAGDTYNAASDAIVPLYSQVDFSPSYLTQNPNNEVQQVVHSAGAETLGFLPPAVMDTAGCSSSAICGPNQVLALLNTPVSNSSVYQVKP
jgi:hypothetical protein